MLDLVVVGAGPHALSLLTRLVDDEPDLLSERARSALMEKLSRARTHGTVKKHLTKQFDGAAALPGVAVVDLHGRWMAQWERDFDALGIHHTRSHANLHPCPFDFQSLHVWAKMKNREAELWHMQYIDREAARAEGYRGPYYLPGTQLFNDFCQSLVTRYNLQPLVQQGSVEDIRVVAPTGSDEEACPGGGPPPCTFEVCLGDGRVLAARRVVCAMGPGPMFRGMRATLPWWAHHLAGSLGPSPALASRMLHSSQVVPWLQGLRGHAHDDLAEGLSGGGGSGGSKVRGRRVLVVGGGQTAGHLALLALESGAAAVTLAARRKLTQKPYDVTLELAGFRRGDALDRFWKLGMEERVQYIQKARGGGSMAHEVYRALMQHVEPPCPCKDHACKRGGRQKQEAEAPEARARAKPRGAASERAQVKGAKGKRSRQQAQREAWFEAAEAAVEAEARAIEEAEEGKTDAAVDEAGHGLASQKAGSEPPRPKGSARRRRNRLKVESEATAKAGEAAEEEGGTEADGGEGEAGAAADGAGPGPAGHAAASASAPPKQPGPPWRLTVLEETEVAAALWTPAPGKMAAAEEEEASGEITVTFDRSYEESSGFDLVWLATGGALELDLVPVLASLRAQRRVPTAGGLPRLQPDLAWDAGCPVHVMGAFAQLELGPDALNLAGARSGSVAVARAIRACPGALRAGGAAVRGKGAVRAPGLEAEAGPPAPPVVEAAAPPPTPVGADSEAAGADDCAGCLTVPPGAPVRAAPPAAKRAAAKKEPAAALVGADAAGGRARGTKQPGAGEALEAEEEVPVAEARGAPPPVAALAPPTPDPLPTPSPAVSHEVPDISQRCRGFVPVFLRNVGEVWCQAS